MFQQPKSNGEQLSCSRYRLSFSPPTKWWESPGSQHGRERDLRGNSSGVSASSSQRCFPDGNEDVTQSMDVTRPGTTAHTGQKTAETQQIELFNKVVILSSQPLCNDRRRWSRQCSEGQQLQFIDKVTKILFLRQRQIPVVQTLSEIPQCRLCRENKRSSCTRLLTRQLLLSKRRKPNRNNSAPARLFNGSVTHHRFSQQVQAQLISNATRLTQKTQTFFLYDARYSPEQD